MLAHAAVSGSSIDDMGRGGSERIVKILLFCG